MIMMIKVILYYVLINWYRNKLYIHVSRPKNVHISTLFVPINFNDAHSDVLYVCVFPIVFVMPTVIFSVCVASFMNTLLRLV